MSGSGAPVGARRLGPAFDLLAVYRPGATFIEREGLGLVTLEGSVSRALTADRCDPESLRELSAEAMSVLRSLGDGGAADPGPVAVGAIAFDPEESVALTIPAGVVRRTEPGATWLVGPGVDDHALPSTEARFGDPAAADAFAAAQLREEPTAGAYADAVAGLVARIGAREVDKVVLARTLEVDAGRTLDAARLLHRLRAVEPHCYTFAVPVPGDAAGPGPGRTLVGASPELLCSRRGDVVRSVPLAGSAPRSGDPDEDRANAEALEASDKERREHAFVVDAIAAALGERCSDLTWDPEPVLLETANVWHLATRFEGRLRDPEVGSLALVADLHPTPAVCGVPVDAARAAIAELEPVPRGRYAGPVGWMDASGDGEWAIALRCAELEGDRARLFAGAGIVAGSDPAAEVEETRRKFLAFLDSLRWG